MNSDSIMNVSIRRLRRILARTPVRPGEKRARREVSLSEVKMMADGLKKKRTPKTRWDAIKEFICRGTISFRIHGKRARLHKVSPRELPAVLQSESAQSPPIARAS